jgi:hypothetical protein
MVTGKTIYPRRKDLHGKFFYLCEPCKAYCGCHPSTNKPLGTLANEKLRKLRSMAHAAFDPKWQDGDMRRRDAYEWLSDKMQIMYEDCHIGMFNEKQCWDVIEICNREGLK